LLPGNFKKCKIFDFFSISGVWFAKFQRDSNTTIQTVLPRKKKTEKFHILTKKFQKQKILNANFTLPSPVTSNKTPDNYLKSTFFKKVKILIEASPEAWVRKQTKAMRSCRRVPNVPT
jgi:hypothetical protein